MCLLPFILFLFDLYDTNASSFVTHSFRIYVLMQIVDPFPGLSKEETANLTQKVVDFDNIEKSAAEFEG